MESEGAPTAWSRRQRAERLAAVLARTADVLERSAGLAAEHAECARDGAQHARVKAAGWLELSRELGERERRADERDRSADERDRSADERESAADERETRRERDREPQASAPHAASLERLHGYLDERERRANERERAADERERIAEERDQTADERQRIADVRDYQISQARPPRLGDIQRQRQEILKRARRASDRNTAQIDRLLAELARKDTDRQRNEAATEYGAARSELGNSDSTR